MNHAVKEKVAYNALAILFNSSYKELEAFFSRYGSWENTLNALPVSRERTIDKEKEWELLEKCGVHLILREDEEYPSLLREIPLPPHGLYVKGILQKTQDHAVAIVGTRKATHEGTRLAKEFGFELAQRGVCIISGLALGVDAAAHEGSLEARGMTIAVLGNGLDHIYPRTNERLGRRILEAEGAIISEYPLNAPALPYHFLERNRIVSGLGEATLVIEAPRESGSLVTARFALEQNRSVFVVPGPVHHPHFKGSHELIREGAELVTEPSHILESLGIEKLEGGFAQGDSPAVPEEYMIVHALKQSSSPLSIDKLTELTNLNVQTVSRALTLLLVRNTVHEEENGYSLSHHVH